MRAGDRVAVWPVLACGACYPCSIGRENVCANIAIIGAHVDGALQERLVVPASQVFAVGDMAPAVTAFVEPTSIGVRTVVRARVTAEDRVVVLGAGPIGQAVCLAAAISARPCSWPTSCPSAWSTRARWARRRSSAATRPRWPSSCANGRAATA